VCGQEEGKGEFDETAVNVDLLRPCIEIMAQKSMDAKDPSISDVERRSRAGQLTGLDALTGCFPCSCCTDREPPKDDEGAPEVVPPLEDVPDSDDEGDEEETTAFNKPKCGECGNKVNGIPGNGVVVNKRVCRECCACLKKGKVPKKALVNDTWQGVVPECMESWGFGNLDGLTPTEASMIAINLVIQESTILSGGELHGSFCICFL